MTRIVPRILLLGGQGQVAWELRRTLAPLGVVFVWDRNAEPSVDLSHPEGLWERIEQLRPTWIINAAAYTAVDKAEQEAEMAMTINGIAPGILAQAAAEIGALLVHYSTDYVFDGKSTRPYCEDAATNPLNMYGQSKLAGEKAIHASGASHLILRTSWVYGVRGTNFLRTIRRLAREREELRIVSDQIGAPTWSRHIAEATAQVLAQLGTDKEAWRHTSGVYHLTSAGETSWYEFATRIVAQQRQYEEVNAHTIIPIATEDYPLPAPRPRYSVLDNTKIFNTFGVRLPDWKVALEHVLEEIEQQTRS